MIHFFPMSEMQKHICAICEEETPFCIPTWLANHAHVFTFVCESCNELLLESKEANATLGRRYLEWEESQKAGRT